MITQALTLLGGGASGAAKYFKWILLAAVLYLAYTMLMPVFRRWFGFVPDDAPYFVGGGDVLESFAKNTDFFAQRLRKGLNTTVYVGENTLRCEAINMAMGWNSNQLISIHNTYKNKYRNTLYADLSKVYGDGCSNLFEAEKHSQLSEKIAKIGLS